jgi:hypothetical protein
LQRLPRKRGLLSGEILDLAKRPDPTQIAGRLRHAEQRNTFMRIPMIAAVMLAALPVLAVGSPSAEAKGCLKGALVGGVAGHYAGHHGVLGAIGGCAVGHHMANEKAKEQAAPAAQNAPGASPAPTTN